MPTRTITSDPRPSHRNPGWYFVYYDGKSVRGTDCVALIPGSLRDIVHKGHQFEDHQLQYDDTIKATVLSVDFDTPDAAVPSLPVNQDAGWRDPDHSTELADPQHLQSVRQHLESSLEVTAAQLKPVTLDPGLQALIDQVCLAYAHTCKRLGVNERPRAMEAQKLLTTCLIPWLRNNGAVLNDEDIKSISYP